MEGKPEEKKGLLKKLKDGIEDQEAQIQILGTFVRLGVVVWSGFIITLNYVEIPMIKKSGNSDITFVASVFTGALATFGLTTGNKDGKGKPVNCPMATKKKSDFFQVIVWSYVYGLAIVLLFKFIQDTAED